MTTFHNPYHFVPIHEDPNPYDPLRRQAGPTAETFRQEGLKSHDGRLAHDHYRGLSGRLLVKLETKTPLVIGAEQPRPDNDYALVEPYLFKDEPAIPATSLKGMLGTLIEAASHSAMRVMADTRPVSWRQPMQQALSALGRIERDEETGELQLRPLTVPNGTLTGQRIDFGARHDLWCCVFADYGNFKVHIQPPATVPERNKLSYRRIGPGGPFRDGKLSFAIDPHTSRRNHALVLGQRSPGTPLSHAAYRKRRDSGQDVSGYVRGFVRVLGKDDRPDIPNNKYHELFIPYPPDIKKRVAALPIPAHVIEAFNQLADERTAEQAERAKKKGDTLTPRQRLPYLPFGTAEEEKKDRLKKPDDQEAGRIWARLRPGHIVYFDVADTPAHGLHVSALSFSAIWRGLAIKDHAPASLRDFVEHPELRPMTPERQTITPAEWLMGFVEDRANQKAAGTPDKNTAPHPAYAGRLRVSMARLADPAEAEAPGFWVEDPKTPDHRVRLKTLGSPKPPSPQLYMEKKDNPAGFIPKHEIDLARHRAKGRKLYLHQKPNDEPWKTRVTTGEDEEKQRKLKNAVRPISTGQTFWFHIDFDNLAPDELDLLCFALRPTADFRHKLGMGKPIGLGSVKLTPEALCLVDRQARYTTSDPLTAPRYTTIAVEPGTSPATWPTRLWPREKTEAATTTHTTPTDHARRWQNTLEAHYPTIATALRLIGEDTTHHQANNIHTPLTDDQYAGTAGAETNTYQWFAANNHHKNKKRQQLRSLRVGDAKLPTLQKLEKPKKT